jgi:hypothetical protein
MKKPAAPPALPRITAGLGKPPPVWLFALGTRIVPLEGIRYTNAYNCDRPGVGGCDGSLASAEPAQAEAHAVIHAREGWLGVRDDFRNWLIRAA